jgi:hypothetical protein
METLKAIARIEGALRRARDTNLTPFMQSKLAEIADTLYHLFPEEIGTTTSERADAYL